MTLKIEAASDGQTATLRLIGRFEWGLDELGTQVRRHCPRLVLDLDEVTLVDVAVVRSLIAYEDDGIELQHAHLTSGSDEQGARPRGVNTFRAEVDVVSLHGIPVAMRTVGTGEPLVILHRFRGPLVRWDPVLIDALARRRRVFDSPGVGDTPGEAPSTVEQMADFGADVLRPIGDSAVDVLGRSFGGLVAQKLAINEPRLVSQLVLAATMPPAGSAEVTWSQERLRNASNPVASVDAILPLFLTPTAASQSAGRESVTLTPCATATAVSPRSMAA